VFNTTFSNISAISWRPVLVVEEVGVPGENHRPWNSTWEPGLGRSGIEQGGYQMLALLITMAIAIVGGTITGTIKRSQLCSIGGGNRRTRRKPPTCPKSLTNFIT
jgi:hypothetical protein